jgi:hypothetical protein
MVVKIFTWGWNVQVGQQGGKTTKCFVQSWLLRTVNFFDEGHHTSCSGPQHHNHYPHWIKQAFWPNCALGRCNSKENWLQLSSTKSCLPTQGAHHPEEIPHHVSFFFRWFYNVSSISFVLNKVKTELSFVCFCLCSISWFYSSFQPPFLHYQAAKQWTSLAESHPVGQGWPKL